MSYKLRITNSTGGEWLHEGEEYVDLYDAKIAAQMAFDDHYVDSEDIIQAYEVPADPDDGYGDAAEEYERGDFNIAAYEQD